MKKSKTLFFIIGMAYPTYSIVDMTIKHIEQNLNVLYLWAWIILVSVPMIFVLIRIDTSFNTTLKSSLNYEAYILTSIYILIAIVSYKSSITPGKDVPISLGATLLWMFSLQAGIFCWYFFRYRYSPYKPISTRNLGEIDSLIYSLEKNMEQTKRNNMITRKYLREIVITGRLKNARQIGLQGKVSPPDLQKEIEEIKNQIFLLQ